jgi:C4-dicarboxylate transporter DctQ subunit
MKQGLVKYRQAAYRLIPQTGSLLANLGLCAMVILTAANAILRYVFGWTPRWGDEICAFLVIFVVFLGTGSALIEERHIRVTAVLSKLPVQAQNIVQVICGVIALLFVGYLGYSITQVALISLEIHARTMNGIPLFPIQIWLPIGLFILFIPLVGFTIKRIVIALHSRGEEMK